MPYDYDQTYFGVIHVGFLTQMNRHVHLEAVLSHPNNVFLDILGSGRIQTLNCLSNQVYCYIPAYVDGCSSKLSLSAC